MAMLISRRGVVLGATLALPVLGVVGASDLKTPFTPDRRQRRVLETQQCRRSLKVAPRAHATNLDERYDDSSR